MAEKTEALMKACTDITHQLKQDLPAHQSPPLKPVDSPGLVQLGARALPASMESGI